MLDLAIVGAGAAGVSAAREARRRGWSAVLLEASEHIGGRAHTVRANGEAVDLGAGWLHSAERNPLTALAEAEGFAIDRLRTPWREQLRGLGFSREEQAEARAASAAFEDRLRATTPDADVAAEALEPNNRWNAYIDAMSGFLNGTSLRNLSATDYVAYGDAATAHNWRIEDGYGSLIAALARDLDIRTGVAVGQIEWDGAVRLTTAAGSIEARRAIVAVSTDVLASGAIGFLPGADAHLHAASQLPLGHVEKLYFALDDPADFPADAHLLGDPARSETGSYMLRPMGKPVIEAFFGGDWVLGQDADALENLARTELGRLLGSDFATALRRVAASHWQSEPFIMGSYSYARPGQHQVRATLAAPLDGRVAFAGEAASLSDFSTVHGAWQSGIDAVGKLAGAKE